MVVLVATTTYRPPRARTREMRNPQPTTCAKIGSQNALTAPHYRGTHYHYFYNTKVIRAKDVRAPLLERVAPRFAPRLAPFAGYFAAELQVWLRGDLQARSHPFCRQVCMKSC